MTRYCLLAAALFCILTTASSAFASVEILALRLDVSEEYTDNLFLTDTDKQTEFTTIVSPGFDYSASVKEGGLDVSYTAGYAMYHKSAEDSFLRHRATVSMWSNPEKHTRATFRNFFLWTDKPVQYEGFNLLGYVEFDDQLLPVLDTTLRTGLYEYITDTAVGDLLHQFGDNNSINLRGLVSIRDEINSVYDNDNRRLAPSVDLTYWITPKFGIDLSAVYTRGIFVRFDNFNDWRGTVTLRRKIARRVEVFAEYDQMMRRYDAAIGNYDNYAGSGGIRYETDNDVSLTLGAGYFLQDLEAGEDVDGFFFNGSVDKTWTTPRGTARAIGSAGLDRNEFGSENLGLMRFYALGTTASYRLTEHFSAAFNATARVSEYLNSPINRTDYFGNAGFSLTYIARSWLSFRTAFNHNLIRGRGERNYDENSAALTVSFTPQGRRY